MHPFLREQDDRDQDAQEDGLGPPSQADKDAEHERYQERDARSETQILSAPASRVIDEDGESGYEDE